MAHVRIRYRSAQLAAGQMRAEVQVGPDAAHLRAAGELLLHPSELNAIDRLLHVGSQLERPAHTYTISQED